MNNKTSTEYNKTREYIYNFFSKNKETEIMNLIVIHEFIYLFDGDYTQ